MARRLSPQGIQTHPQLKRIIDAILEGKESDRDIAKWVRPAIAHSSIYNYRKNVVEPSIRNAEKLKEVLAPNKVENTAFSDVQPVQELVEQQPEQLVRSALLAAPVLAVRENRIKAQQDRHNRLQMIVEERAASPLFANAPGGKSGLLGLDYKGKDGDIAVYKVDTGLLSEFREHEKQIAQELGQWAENTGVTVAVQIVMPATAGAAQQAESELEYIDIGE